MYQMKAFQSFSLRTRLLSLVAVTITVGFGAIAITLTMMATSMQTESARANEEQLASAQAAQITSTFNSAIRTAQTIAQVFEVDVSSGGADRTVADSMLRHVAEANPQFLSVATAWEPNGFDGADAEHVNDSANARSAQGRYASAASRNSSGAVFIDRLGSFDKPEDPAGGAWYNAPKASGTPAVIEPYTYPIDGKDVLMTTVAVPVVVSGKFRGVVSVDFSLESIRAELGKIHPFGAGYVSLVSHDGIVVSHPDSARVGRSVGDKVGFQASQAKLSSGGQIFSEGQDAYLNVPVNRVVVPMTPEGTDAQWQFEVAVPQSVVRAPVATMRDRTIVIAVVSVLAACALLALMLNRMVLRPVGGEPESASNLARSIAAGDLSIHEGVGAAAPDGSIINSMTLMLDRLRTIITEMANVGTSVAEGATEISHGNDELSRRTENQAASLEETSATLEQLSQTVRQNAEDAVEANKMADKVNVLAKAGNVAVDDVAAKMRQFVSDAARMTGIIETIEGIAFQTNILALNASIEAAQAGAHGRGFAVVAGEVRTLAQRCSAASREIRGLVDQSTSRTEEGVAVADHAAKTIAELSGSIENVGAVVAGIARASQEQSDGIAQINTVVAQLDTTTQQNAALVEESAAVAAALKQHAEQLRETIGVFRV
ncbi:methyl-accepting chemotaxis protein [Paraburkholderia bannensis]|uniref:methyl-accepting chemotaxis protein n=1 Tax=Paraburkholderia bannensis TaxID=765414 RepID=UPI002AC3568D|nr:methyl-accepting chemotaxis protein [Paraburkholderia bannensis]